MRLALFQPDNPRNVGGAIRLCACLGVPLDIVRPTGFPLDSRDVRRSALDYGASAEIVLHDGWSAFQRDPGGRLVLLTTGGAESLYGFTFHPGDVLLVGRESAGVPPEVHDRAGARVYVPMAPGARALNVVVAAAMALSEARRQLGH
ncbi:MAG: TrmH family RNA methyltransferase [Pseudomonadota bacterium]|nr:TrmH family RNA methyltransferase [Pseudomonadota bacterium]